MLRFVLLLTLIVCTVAANAHDTTLRLLPVVTGNAVGKIATANVSIPVLASGVTRVSGCLVLYQELAWREVLQ